MSICASHHRWHSLISCTLSVLYVWITDMTKNLSFLISSGLHFHYISSLISFIVQTNWHLSWGIDSFTLQWSSCPFFFSIRGHSMKSECSFCKKADFLDKDLSKYRWISRSLRSHPMELCGNIMIHFLCRFTFWFCEWDWCHDVWWKNILTCRRKILNIAIIISHS